MPRFQVASWPQISSVQHVIVVAGAECSKFVSFNVLRRVISACDTEQLPAFVLDGKSSAQDLLCRLFESEFGTWCAGAGAELSVLVVVCTSKDARPLVVPEHRNLELVRVHAAESCDLTGRHLIAFPQPIEAFYHTSTPLTVIVLCAERVPGQADLLETLSNTLVEGQPVVIHCYSPSIELELLDMQRRSSELYAVLRKQFESPERRFVVYMARSNMVRLVLNDKAFRAVCAVQSGGNVIALYHNLVPSPKPLRTRDHGITTMQFPDNAHLFSVKCRHWLGLPASADWPTYCSQDGASELLGSRTLVVHHKSLFPSFSADHKVNRDPQACYLQVMYAKTVSFRHVCANEWLLESPESCVSMNVLLMILVMLEAMPIMDNLHVLGLHRVFQSAEAYWLGLQMSLFASMQRRVCTDMLSAVTIHGFDDVQHKMVTSAVMEQWDAGMHFIRYSEDEQRLFACSNKSPVNKWTEERASKRMRRPAWKGVNG